MQLHIPEGERELLKSWLWEDNESTEKLFDALSKAQPTLGRDKLAEQVEGAVSADSEEVSRLIHAFFNLFLTANVDQPDELQQYEDAILKALEVETSDAAKRTRFARRLRSVIESESIQLSSKALRVKYDDQYPYCEARTTSEIRPILNDPELRPKAAVIVHRLRIAYHSGPDLSQRELYVAMDLGDLKALRSVADRAIKKHEQLRDLVDKSGLALLEVGE